MKRRFHILLIVLSCLLLFPTNILGKGTGEIPPYAFQMDVGIMLDGETLPIPPDMGRAFVDSRTERTMVPVRFLAETLGYQVQFQREDQGDFVLLTKGDTILILHIGSNRALRIVGEQPTALTSDGATYAYAGRTYVPLRFVGEILGMDVDWDQQRHNVLMSRDAFGKKPARVKRMDGVIGREALFSLIREGGYNYDRHIKVNFRDPEAMFNTRVLSHLLKSAGHQSAYVSSNVNGVNFDYAPSNTGTLEIWITYQYKMSEEEHRETMDFARKWAKENITDSMSDLEKVETIFNYIRKNYTYNLAFTRTIDMIRTGEGLCSAFSSLFEILAREAGIDSLYVYDTETINHGWNLVKIDDNWYHIDVTWCEMDEHIPDYYLVGDGEMRANGRKWDQTYLPKAPHCHPSTVVDKRK